MGALAQGIRPLGPQAGGGSFQGCSKWLERRSDRPTLPEGCPEARGEDQAQEGGCLHPHGNRFTWLRP